MARRSISIVASGSALIIHEDPRYSGGNNCAQCEFGQQAPCRIQRYYDGPIEDCKLCNRRDPAEFLEIRDLRDPGDLFGVRAEVDSGKPVESSPRERLLAVVEEARARLLDCEGPKAYRLLILAKDRAYEAEGDPEAEEVLRAYEALFLFLREELGGLLADAEPRRTDFGRELETLLQSLRQGVAGRVSADGEEPARLESMVRRGEIEVRYRLWLFQRYLTWCRAVERAPCLDVLQDFERAVERGDDELELEIIRLRVHAMSGDSVDGADAFLRLRPRFASARDAMRRMQWLGYVAEALAYEREPRARQCVEIATEARALYLQLLARQLGSEGRRRFRQRCQHTLEGCLAALGRSCRARTSGRAKSTKRYGKPGPWSWRRGIRSSSHPEEAKSWVARRHALLKIHCIVASIII